MSRVLFALLTRLADSAALDLSCGLQQGCLRLGKPARVDQQQPMHGDRNCGLAGVLQGALQSFVAHLDGFSLADLLPTAEEGDPASWRPVRPLIAGLWRTTYLAPVGGCGVCRNRVFEVMLTERIARCWLSTCCLLCRHCGGSCNPGDAGAVCCGCESGLASPSLAGASAGQHRLVDDTEDGAGAERVCTFRLGHDVAQKGMINGRRSHRRHISVFCHVPLIIILAKVMFYLRW